MGFSTPEYQNTTIFLKKTLLFFSLLHWLSVPSWAVYPTHHPTLLLLSCKDRRVGAGRRKKRNILPLPSPLFRRHPFRDGELVCVLCPPPAARGRNGRGQPPPRCRDVPLSFRGGKCKKRKNAVGKAKAGAMEQRRGTGRILLFMV